MPGRCQAGEPAKNVASEWIGRGAVVQPRAMVEEARPSSTSVVDRQGGRRARREFERGEWPLASKCVAERAHSQ